MNINQAKALKTGTVCEHITLENADGTPLRGRVTGAVKTWKRDETRVQVPMKHGLYDYFYLTAENIQNWSVQS